MSCTAVAEICSSAIFPVVHRRLAPRLERVGGWFESAGVPCRVSATIEADLWIKLITNVGLNAISAVARCPYGDIVRSPEPRETVRQLVQECGP